jgi:fructoselysine-6-P-deglycase FrlB-like protein
MTATSNSLPPIAEDFISTIEKAVAERERAYALTASLVERGVRNVFLVGCGGSLYATYPSQFLFETSNSPLITSHLTANEFNYRRPARLGSDSVVIVASHSGGTAETVQAIETARSAGAAAVIGVTKSPDSKLGQGVDEVFTYGSDHTVWEPKHVLLANLAHGLLFASTGSEDPALKEAYAALPQAARTALDESDDLGHEIAGALHGEPIIYVLGSGPVEGVARCLSMCYLQEMQWIHSGAFNSGEFLHGAFEVVTDEVPVIVFIGEDATRPMGERDIEFLKQYTSKLHVVDSRSLSLEGVPDGLRGEIAPIALGAIVSRLARHFESFTGHDLDTRRYMGKVRY